MAYSYINYDGDGSQVNYSIPFSYLEKPHVAVYVEGILKTVDVHYTWLNDSVIQFTTAPTLDDIISIKRSSGIDARLVDFQTASLLDEPTLDLNSNQLFYLMQEGFDSLTLASGEDSAVFTTPQAILDAFVGSIGLAQMDSELGAAVGYLNTNYTNDAIYEFDEDGTVVYEDEVYHHGYTKLVWIDGNLLVTGTVLADAIAVNAVTADKIFANAITAAKIAAGSIEATHMAVDSILAASIKAGEIDTGHLAADCITATQIDALAVDTEHLAADCITAAKINALAVDTEHLAAGAVEAAKINVTTLHAIVADLGTITAGSITLDADGFIRTYGKDDFADTTPGFFLGYNGTYPDGEYVLNLGDATTFIKWDGDVLLLAAEIAGVIAGNFVEAAADTSNLVIPMTYTKTKEIVIGRSGTWRITFDLKQNNFGAAHARIYKDGVAYGTERSTDSTSWQSYSEDLVFNAGDLCQLYAHGNSGIATGAAVVQLFRTKCGQPIVCGVELD